MWLGLWGGHWEMVLGWCLRKDKARLAHLTTLGNVKLYGDVMFNSALNCASA